MVGRIFHPALDRRVGRPFPSSVNRRTAIVCSTPQVKLLKKHKQSGTESLAEVCSCKLPNILNPIITGCVFA